MSDRIRISDLRQQFAAFSDANALIDAVEAAHAHLDTLADFTTSLQQRERLVAALERFDFDD